MNNFSFLNNITINKVEETPKKASTGREKIERNPQSGLTLRLFKDGSIYPSLELVDKFDLEYNKEKSGNGFDVFPSSNWKQYPQDAENVVFITAVPKSNARVDLFSQAREVNGELTSVMSQGTKTFGLELINILNETYNAGYNTLFEDKKYVDLQVVEEVAINQDIVYIPKMTTKGEHKGMMTTERRENIILYPLSIINPITPLDEVPGNEMVETVLQEELV